MAFPVFRQTIMASLFAAVALLQPDAAMAQSRFVVTTPADSGTGSLRSAIIDANASQDQSTIDFRIDPALSGNGPWTIALTSELPEINTPVIIRGFSQPGASASSTPFSHQMMIEINDSAIPANGNNHAGILTFIRGAERSSVTGLSFIGGRSATGGSSNSSVALLLMANDVRVSANRIGVHADGSVERYAGGAIAALCADSITIGGATASAGNWIGGSDQAAIGLTGNNHTVRFNLLGFDRFGTSSLANTIVGAGIITGAIGYGAPPRLQTIYSAAVQQSFFGLRDSLIADNHISATTRAAIVLNGSKKPTSGNRIDRNTLGRDFWGSAGARVDIGIRLTQGALDNSLSDNLIGTANAGILLGDASTSTITQAGIGNRLSRNLFFDLANRAIGLDPLNHFAVLSNDPLDTDSGPNALQNKPTMTAASTARGIEGTLDAAPQVAHTVEFFLSSSCHPSGVDSAEFFLGSVDVTTDGQGHAQFQTQASSVPLGGLRAGDVITATAKDSFNNTSELSKCFPIAAAAAPTLTLSSLPSPTFAMQMQSISAAIQGAGARQPQGQIVFWVATTTAIRELGRAAISNGQATISPPASGFFAQGGQYQVFAEYAGDGFHLPTRSATQQVVVFRPPSALISEAFSSPVRRDDSSGDREYFETPMRNWRRLNTAAADTYIDAERFGGSLYDSVFVVNSGKYSRVEANGMTSMLNSNQIDANTEVLDLLHLNGDLHVDAVIRDRVSGDFGVVLCAFQIDGCERALPLAVNIELEYRTSGDFDGDGQADLVFRDRGNGDSTVLLMDNGKVRDQYILRRIADERAVAAADLNGDGDEDLVMLDSSLGKLMVFLMKDGKSFAHAEAQLPSKDWETEGAVYMAKLGDPDYGLAQLLLRDSASGEVVIWRRPIISGGQFSASPQSLYFDPVLVPERTR